ncbi:MAG: hypothetical protein U1E53_22535 [Dongiaceae bacterium]
MRGWRVLLIVALAHAGCLIAGRASADEFASQGRACGTPGHPMDMSRIEAAVRQYPNGRLLFLSPAEEARLREQFRQANMAGRSPMQELAPCFGCTQDYGACIAYDGPRQAPGRQPEQFGSDGGPPAPARGDSDACRKNPQSYTCLYGHPGVAAGNPPAVPVCRQAACDDRTLRAQGWQIRRPLGGNDCVWTKAQGQAASAGGYDPDAIDRRWADQWSPEWSRRVQAIFARRQPLLHRLSAKNVRVDWWFAVTVAPDGTVTAVESKDSTYQPRGGPDYKNWMFDEDTEAWRKLLLGLKAPPFPTGSVLPEVVRTVNFNNLQTGIRKDPQVPREPPLQKEQHGAGKIIKGC